VDGRDEGSESPEALPVESAGTAERPRVRHDAWEQGATRRFGFDRKTIRKWRALWKAQGIPGLIATRRAGHSRSPRGSGSSSSRDDGVRSARHRGRRDGLPRAARATRHAARRFTTRPRSPGALTHHVTGIASSRTSSRTRPVPRAGVPQWPGGSRQRPGGSRATKAASESAMKDEVGTTAGCFIMVVRPDSGDVHRGMGPLRASGSERHVPAPGEKFARIGSGRAGHALWTIR
jgi:hypothetical protein